MRLVKITRNNGHVTVQYDITLLLLIVGCLALLQMTNAINLGLWWWPIGIITFIINIPTLLIIVVVIKQSLKFH